MEIKLSEKYEIGTRAFAKMVGRSDERIRQLIQEGVFAEVKAGRKKLLDLADSVSAYVKYLELQNKASGAVDDEARKVKADADWKEAKAAIEEMKRDELRGTLHASEDVEAITTDLIMAIRAELLSLPGTLAVDCAQAKTAREAAGIIKKAVNEMLNGLTAYKYDPKKYEKAVRERESWMQAAAQEAREEEEMENGKGKRKGKK